MEKYAEGAAASGCPKQMEIYGALQNKPQ